MYYLRAREEVAAFTGRYFRSTDDVVEGKLLTKMSVIVDKFKVEVVLF